MTEMASCLSCGKSFERRKVGHLFCSAFCRYRGERLPDEPERVDPALVERLFDESRDPDAPVRVDDWCPGPQVFVELDMNSTVATRRAWFRRLQREGLV
jgi:hypothetical protein